jgi:uncharacterized RDD family membrane protein YckC
MFLLFSIVTIGISSTKVDKLEQQLMDAQRDYLYGNIEQNDYVNELISLNYDIARSSVVINTIYVALLIGYFGVFQYMNKGQTIGKKVLKIRIVENDKEPSLLAIFARTLIINQIFLNIMAILFVYVLNDCIYLVVYGSLYFVNLIFIFVSALMILFRDDKRGLHDMISRTSVVEV